MDEIRTTLLERSVSQPVQVRNEDDSETLLIAGVGAVFYDERNAETEYEIMPGIFERVMPTAFDDIPDDVFSTYNHDMNQLLGRTKAGTLQLTITERGLEYETVINRDDPIAMGVHAKVKRGDVDGSSFWFYIESETRKEEEDKVIYEINKVRLREVGPVAMPAYTATTSEVRSQHQDIRRRMEQEQQHDIKKRLFLLDADMMQRGVA